MHFLSSPLSSYTHSTQLGSAPCLVRRCGALSEARLIIKFRNTESHFCEVLPFAAKEVGYAGDGIFIIGLEVGRYKSFCQLGSLLTDAPCFVCFSKLSNS